MNRADLASAISGNLDIAETDALKFIDSFEHIIRTTLSQGGEVSLDRLRAFSPEEAPGAHRAKSPYR